MSDNMVLKIQDLEVNFYDNERCNKVPRGMSLQLEKGRIIYIVRENGYGKSVIANSTVGLLPDLPRIEEGEVHFCDKGKDIRIDRLKRKGKKIHEIRGDGIVMIFQGPMTALNPAFIVGYQINESLLYHSRAKNKSDTKEKVVNLLKDMEIPPSERRADEYPYQLSGGMCQRAMITTAMSCQPRTLIADEPTTVLDMTTQAWISELMLALKNNHDMVILLITHDMGVVAELANSITVMYMGNIVGSGDARAVLTHSAHPYTGALLKSIPVLGRGKRQELEPIKGSMPDPYNRPKGYQFAPRREFAADRCMKEMPPEVQLEPGHYCRCLYDLTGKEG